MYSYIYSPFYSFLQSPNDLVWNNRPFSMEWLLSLLIDVEYRKSVAEKNEILK